MKLPLYSSPLICCDDRDVSRESQLRFKGGARAQGLGPGLPQAGRRPDAPTGAGDPAVPDRADVADLWIWSHLMNSDRHGYTMIVWPWPFNGTVLASQGQYHRTVMHNGDMALCQCCIYRSSFGMSL